MPQLPEADGSEWKEGEGSWKKPHFGGGGQHREPEQRRNYSDLVMDESRRSVSDSESMTSGNTDEGELELIKIEDPINSLTKVVRGGILENTPTQSPEDDDQIDSHERSREEKQVENVLLAEGEWTSGLTGVNGPFLAARKSKSPIQGPLGPADVVQEGPAQEVNFEENQVASNHQTISIQNYSSPAGGYHEPGEQTWEGEDLTWDEYDLTQERKTSPDLMEREFVPNNLSAQASGILDMDNPSQQDLMTAYNHSFPEDPDKHNDGCGGQICPNEENEQEEDNLNCNQDCPIGKKLWEETAQEDPEESPEEQNNAQVWDQNESKMQPEEGLQRPESVTDQESCESQRLLREESVEIIGGEQPVEIVGEQPVENFTDQELDKSDQIKSCESQPNQENQQIKFGEETREKQLIKDDQFWQPSGISPMI